MRNINYLKENGVDVDRSIELLGDVETFDEILEEFYQNIENRRSELKNYLDSSDMTNYAISVHALKSDSKYLGFDVLASIALEHQTKSENGDLDYISNHFKELDDEVSKIISIIKKYMEE